MILLPYQTTGVDFLASRHAAALGDDPGLGKSAQALSAAQVLRARRVLILCPAIARVSWLKEAARWWPTARAIIAGKAGDVSWNAGDEPVLVIASYDSVALRANKGFLRALLNVHWDVLICDEAHYLKSSSAKRTRAVYGRRCDGVGGLSESADNVWLLSGTLMPNHAGELWTHLRALCPVVLGPQVAEPDFQDKFCRVADTTFGRTIRGSKNLDVLRQRLESAGFVLRRRKADVLTDLPPIRFVDTPAEFSRGDAYEFRQEDKALAAKLMMAADNAELLSLLTQEKDSLSALRRAIGVLKTPPCLEYARTLLDGGTQKLILFAHHTDVIDRLVAGLADVYPVKIDGRDGLKARQDAVFQFENNPAVRVFVGQIQAAGTAVTLTAASDVLMVETSWTPADNYQAVCRAHRIGQRDGVVARFLYVPGTVDERIMRAFRRKAAEISEIFE